MLTRQALTLSLYPVVEIFEVSTAGATAADYDFDPASGRLWTEGCWADVIAVTYSGGYDLPERGAGRLQKAVIEAVNEGRTSGARDPTIREVQHGDTRDQLFHADAGDRLAGFLSAPVVDLIKPYRTTACRLSVSGRCRASGRARRCSSSAAGHRCSGRISRRCAAGASS